MRAKKLGIEDYEKKYNIDDMVKGDVISSKEKFSFKKFSFLSLYFLRTQFFPLTESEFIYYIYLLQI